MSDYKEKNTDEIIHTVMECAKEEIRLTLNRSAEKEELLCNDGQLWYTKYKELKRKYKKLGKLNRIIEKKIFYGYNILV